MNKLLDFTNYWDKYEGNRNYFLEEDFCDNFPLMKRILEINDFDWIEKDDPFTYDILLDELDSEINVYIEDMDRTFLVSENCKNYLYQYFLFLRAEFERQGEELYGSE